MQRYIVFDVETTGLPKNFKISPSEYNVWPHIVQFSWLVVDEKKNINKEKNFIIKPNNYIIPIESIKIHGISNEKALNEGFSIEDILDEFETDCENVDYLVAHNGRFDKNVILASYYRYNKNIDSIKNKKILCTMKSTTNLCKLQGKYGYKYPKLEELIYIFLIKNLSIYITL